MRRRVVIPTAVLCIAIVCANACRGGSARPEGALSVAELLADPVYDTEVTIYGEVSALGELFCPCFVLSSEGESVEVWYDLMVEESGTARPAVSVEGIENADRVAVTGELRSSDGLLPSTTFWASSIQSE